MQNLITSYFSIFPFSFGAVEDVDPWQLIFIFNFSFFFSGTLCFDSFEQKIDFRTKGLFVSF